MIGSRLPLDKSMVPEPDQLPANWPKGPSLGANPCVARLCALPPPSLKTKIVNAKAATRSIMLEGLECTAIIEILESLGNGPVDPTTPSPHLGSPRGTARSPSDKLAEQPQTLLPEVSIISEQVLAVLRKPL